MAEPYVYNGRDYRNVASLHAWLARQQPEEILEPDLSVVDPHHHLWDSERGRYLLDELLDDLASGHRIVRTMFLECQSMYRATGQEEFRAIGEVEFVRGVAAMSASGTYGPIRVASGMVARAELSLGARIRPVLEAEIEAGGGIVRGIRACMPWDPHEEINRHIFHHAPPGFLRNPGFREGVAQLAPLGLVLDIWIYFTQIPDLIDLARALPNTRIVLNHCGGPICVGPYAGHREKCRAVWEKDLRKLAKCPNVYIKLGGLGMVHFGFDFHLREVPPSSIDLAEAWRPYIETCIDAFGVRRGMFESNFPPDKQSCNYFVLWNTFKRIVSGASAEEKEALFSGTATEVYGLT
jgi:predicted TIM-barrel fold metal-dependent hydrolase